MATVLVVDDDPSIRDLLRLYVTRDGHRVVFATDGAQALVAAHQHVPDLVLLDVMLPGIDGLEVCRQLRENSDVPIMLLTARSGDSDKVVGLDLGADDYVVKPFSPRELMARIRAQLRRRTSAALDDPVLTSIGLMVDPSAMEVQVNGRPVEITSTEFRILHALMRRAGRVFTRDELISASYVDDPGILDRTIDVHVGRLRRKLGDSSASPRYVATVRGVGYKFVSAVEARASEG
ncbi:MAG: response regulator transcription factor [Chloroflexi bacterium]|nr:response regulator transcription factor [Chloroflexota bacterium]